MTTVFTLTALAPDRVSLHSPPSPDRFPTVTFAAIPSLLAQSLHIATAPQIYTTL